LDGKDVKILKEMKKSGDGFADVQVGHGGERLKGFNLVSRSFKFERQGGRGGEGLSHSEKGEGFVWFRWGNGSWVQLEGKGCGVILKGREEGKSEEGGQ
jgi:hypothetical protein